MKKLITILSSFGLVITTGTTAVACNNNQPSSLKPTEDENTSLTSNPENNGSENTDSIQNKEEEVTKIKGQISQLEEAKQKYNALLTRISEGN
ncbi:lipoprotein [Mycoplasma mycoides]|uniref:lipoprotein n=1 Tax=Mycoplasma mycoides TaxID=2102 RepID=UPI002733B150|nr:lipoprotein [Mycoplasma mycoides]MDP4040560.1 lipoprotein [Mycoplasma mycoides]MDP4041422.1 lipoprotein [Mycoplasma mycoides]MDP4041921.1 lipoprotein [Mycoplasma mycoides]MDP4043301.1 lipoprotein [Mycoplasma mycoides]MDP4044168.1 lipoprotein [Mycoplasma mycoides]